MRVLRQVGRQAASGPAFSTATGRSIAPGTGLVIAVQPVRGATGDLWSVSQNNLLTWQNLAYDGVLSGPRYFLNPGAGAYRRLHAGPFQITARAHLRPDIWTNASVAYFTMRGPAAAPTPIPPTPVPPTPVPPTPVPQIHAGDVLYTADVNTLNGGQEWKHTAGMLVNDGTAASTILLPYKSPVTDYAVEAEIQFIGGNVNGVAGLRARMTGSSGGVYGYLNGYEARLSYDNSDFSSANYKPDADFHTYRLEVRGNEFRLLVDGTPVVDSQDNHYLTGNQAGLYDNRTQINVRAIRVIAL